MRQMVKGLGYGLGGLVISSATILSAINFAPVNHYAIQKLQNALNAHHLSVNETTWHQQGLKASIAFKSVTIPAQPLTVNDVTMTIMPGFSLSQGFYWQTRLSASDLILSDAIKKEIETSLVAFEQAHSPINASHPVLEYLAHEMQSTQLNELPWAQLGTWRVDIANLSLPLSIKDNQSWRLSAHSTLKGASAFLFDEQDKATGAFRVRLANAQQRLHWEMALNPEFLKGLSEPFPLPVDEMDEHDWMRFSGWFKSVQSLLPKRSMTPVRSEADLYEPVAPAQSVQFLFAMDAIPESWLKALASPTLKQLPEPITIEPNDFLRFVLKGTLSAQTPTQPLSLMPSKRSASLTKGPFSVHDLSASWQFNEMSLHSQAGSLSGVTGELLINEQGITASLQSPALQWQSVAQAEPIAINASDLTIWGNGTDWLFSLNGAETLSTALSGYGWYKKTPDSQWMMGQWSHQATTWSNLRPLLQVLPVPEKLSTYLSQVAQDELYISEGQGVIAGTLGHNIFESSTTQFNYTVGVAGDSIQYAPNWPLLSHAQTKLTFQPNTLTIEVPAAQYEQTTLNHVKVLIHDWHHPESVFLKTQLSGPFSAKDGDHFLVHSPLQSAFESLFETFSFEGTPHLDYQMRLALTGPSAFKPTFKGTVALDNVSVTTPLFPLFAGGLQGVVAFDNQSVEGDDLTLVVEDDSLAVALDVSLPAQGGGQVPKVVVTTHGEVSANHAAEVLLPTIAPYVSGTAMVDVVYQLSDKARSELRASSDLQGVSIALPAPLNKPEAVTWPSLFALNWQGEAQHMTFALANELRGKANFITEEGKPRYQAVSLQMGDGEWDVPLIDKQLQLVGHTQAVNLMDWQAVTANWSPCEWIEKPEFHGDITVESLDLKALTWPKTRYRMKSNAPRDGLEILLSGNEIEGTVLLPAHESNPIEIDLNYIRLPEMNLASNQALDGFSLTRPVHLSSQYVERAHSIMQGVKVNLAPVDSHRMLLESLEINEPLHQLHSTGMMETKPPFSWRLKGQWQSENMPHGFEWLGLKPSLTSGRGQLHFNLSGQGLPGAANLPHTTGHCHLTLNNGLINGLNPGIGRVLGLLNIDSIERRLSLNFDDVAEDGFSYDSLKGDFVFKDQALTTHQLSIEGPSATIRLSGAMNLNDFSLQGETQVTPNLSGSLPLAATVASGNPAIGAAVWLANKVLGRPFSQMAQYNYAIEGSLGQPQLKPLKLSERNQLN